MLAEAHNLTRTNSDPTAHAEVVAITSRSEDGVAVADMFPSLRGLIFTGPGWALSKHPVYFTIFTIIALLVWSVIGGAIMSPPPIAPSEASTAAAASASIGTPKTPTPGVFNLSCTGCTATSLGAPPRKATRTTAPGAAACGCCARTDGITT